MPDTRLPNKAIRNRPAVTTQAELIAYNDQPTIVSYQGRSFSYKSDSALAIDNVSVYPATGKGAGQWVMNNTNVNAATMNISSLRAISLLPSLAPTAVYVTDTKKQGTFYLDPSDTTSADNGGTILVANGLRYKRPFTDGISPLWFGATGDDDQDDAPAIQAAVNFAKSQHVASGGNKKVDIKLPNGSYQIRTPINITGADGIWISGGHGGGGGKYEKTTINGLTGTTGGMMFDFTGSTMSGCNNLTFFSGYTTVAGSTPSTIGVLYAFSAGNAGLNCGIKDVFFLMGTSPSVNNGLGRIGILNCRSEEFVVSDVVARADSAAIFTSFTTFSTAICSSYTVVSPFTSVAGGAGSMGVVRLEGQMSLSSEVGAGHCLTLYGVNTLDYFGYMFHGGGAAGVPKIGMEDAAIGFYRYNFNVRIMATIESAYTIARLDTNGKWEETDIRAGYSNMYVKNKPCFVMNAGSSAKNNRFTVIFGNGSADQPGDKYFMYSPPVDGDTPVTATFADCDFTSPVWTYPAMGISKGLLKNANGFNRVALGGQAAWLQNDEVVMGFKLPRTVGTTTGSAVDLPVDVAHFVLADKATTTTGNGGSYVFKIKGVVTVGTYSTTNSAKAAFEATLLVLQKADGTRMAAESTTLIIANTTTSAAYVTINTIKFDMTTSGPFGALRMTVNVKGTSSGDTVTYKGTPSIISDFAVNAALLFD